MGIDSKTNTPDSPKLNVGVLIDTVDTYFNRRALHDLLTSAEENNIRLAIFPCNTLDRDSISSSWSFASKLMDPHALQAIIIFPHSVSPFSPKSLAALLLERCRGIPCYTLFGHIPGYFGIKADEQDAIREMVRHLAEDHAFTRFGFLCGPDSHESISRERQDTVTRLLAERKISVDPAQIFPGSFTAEDGKKTAGEILSRREDAPEVLVCMNDQMAIGAVREFQDQGVSVPSDIAVVGFDDVEETGSLSCTFTSINLPVWDISSALMKRIATDASGETSYQALHLAQPAEFMNRESCGCSSWLDKKLPANIPFRPLEQKRTSLITLRRAALLRRSLEETLEQALQNNDVSVFTNFVNETFIELSRSGDLTSSFMDTFSTQWTVSLLKHRELDQQIFINTLFVDALRQLFQIKSQVFSEANERNLAALAFYREGSELLSQNKSIQHALRGIASNITRLGVSRALLVFLCPGVPEFGEIRMTLRAGSVPEVPGSNFIRIPLSQLITPEASGMDGELAVLSIFRNNTIYGFLLLSIFEQQFEQFSLIQQVVSKVIDSAMTHDMLSFRLTSLARSNEDLSKLSTLDEFTGLSNRRALYLNGKTMFESACESGQTSCFVFLDMDDLKKINDSFGHAEGDIAILAFSEILKNCFRENDLVVRYGGDEFVVLMTNISEKAMQNALSRVRSRIDEYNSTEGHPWTLSASWGFVFNAADEKTKSFESIIEDSDAALYEQKRLRKAKMHE